MDVGLFSKNDGAPARPVPARGAILTCETDFSTSLAFRACGARCGSGRHPRAHRRPARAQRSVGALREIPARLVRTAVMSSNLIGLIIAALGTIVTVAVAIGLPALAIVAVRFFKFKERELTLGMEHRQKSQQHELAIEQRMQGVEQRVQRLEEVLTSLDHDVRDRLGIESSPATSLSSHPELVEGPPAPDAQREESLEPVPTKAR